MADTKPPTNLIFNLHTVIDKLKHSLNFQMKMKRKYLKDLLEAKDEIKRLKKIISIDETLLTKLNRNSKPLG